jgi:ketosteroid isomerase-like protein
MSEENAEIMRGFYEQFAHGDFSSFSSLRDDFKLVTSPELPDAGTYWGGAAINWMTAWVESFDDLTMEATEITAAGDKVVIALHQRGRPRRSPSVVEGRWWQVTTLRDGEIVEIQIFPQQEQALEAAGLSE